MTLLETAYGALSAVARPLLPAAGAASPRLARAVAGRRTALAGLRRWGQRGRRPGARLVWVHGASAGELIGAAPILEALRAGPFARSAGGLQLLVTHASPSGEETAAALGADGSGYLPLDTLREMGAAIRAVRPDAIVFAKLDVWPGLTRAAERAGVRLGLVNGTVRRGSSRLRPLARRLLAPAYGRLSLAGAVSVEDAERLRALGVRPEALRVTGDAAFDRALARAAAAPRSPAAQRLPVPPAGVPRLVAGSTWPPDEEALLAAAARLAAAGRPLHLVLVPHRPEAAVVARLAERCRAVLGRAPVLWSGLPEPGSSPPGSAAAAREGPPPAPPGGALPPLVVDATGVLADLYAGADLAYVGGGLGGPGLHSVIEPAAAGVPVLFGARHDRSEADALRAAGGGRGVETAADLAGAIAAWAEDPAARERAGRAALACVRAGAGAAEAGARLIEELLAGPSAAPAPGADPGCTRAGAR